MSSPWELRATAIANAQPQMPSETRNSARHTAAATASASVTPKTAGSDATRNTALPIHDAVTMRLPFMAPRLTAPTAASDPAAHPATA